MSYKNLIALLVVVALIIVAIVFLESKKSTPLGSGGDEELPLPLISLEEGQISLDKTKRYEQAKEITTPDGFINSEPFKLADFVGKKVILLDIWTYSCINCQRTIPRINEWQEKYADKGLLIVGLHTPEFEFEKDIANVREAVKKFGIKYPVVLDNDYSTWRAYRNQYWPRKYLIDIDGFIVYDHIGEGGYAETEGKIQDLLEERAKKLGEKVDVIGTVTGEEGDGITYRISPETYFGALRNTLLANGLSRIVGVQELQEPKRVEADRLYLVGKWNMGDEYAESVSGAAKIIYRFRGKNVYFVARADSPIKISVLRDGVPVKAEAGADVKVSGAKSEVTIGESRLYKLIEEMESGEHLLELIIPASGLQAFTFTFG